MCLYWQYFNSTVFYVLQKEEYRAKERSASPHNSKPVESSKCDRDGDSEVNTFIHLLLGDQLGEL